MAELKTVVLSSIKANPYRDLDVFPYVEPKVKALVDSIEAEGFWEGVIVREVKREYEAAFGHHRLEAARRAGLKSVPVIVRDLTDEQMVRMMERENAEEGWGFYYTTVQAVRAAVLAYGAGSVELPIVEADTPKDRIRYAPSFLRSRTDTLTSKSYTAETLANWLKISDDKVKDALALLAGVEAGDLDLKLLADPDITRAAATLAVRAAKAAAKAREDSIAAERSIREEAKKLATKQDNKPKAAAQQRAIDQLDEKLIKESIKAARDAASDVLKRVKDGDSAKEIARDMRDSLLTSVKHSVDTATKDVSRTVCGMSADEKHTLASALDRVLTERTVERALETAKGGKADKVLAEAVKRLEARARAFARKLEA